MSLPRTYFLYAAFAAFLGAASASPVVAGSGNFLEPRKAAPHPAGASGLCRKYAWACQPSTDNGAFDTGHFEIAFRINRAINNRVREVSDFRQYNAAENWALPTQRGGDCEDFALLKKLRLIEAGVPADRLLIATVLDRNLRGHAVLVLRTDRGDWVLDNLTNEILHWSTTGYTFMKMQNPDEPGTWNMILAGGIARPIGT